MKIIHKTRIPTKPLNIYWNSYRHAFSLADLLKQKMPKFCKQLENKKRVQIHVIPEF